MRLLLSFLLSMLFITPALADEGAGLLVSDLNGALPKNLWADQKRSEIIKGLRGLRVESDLESVQTIKRNMLISTYDVSVIENDIPVTDDDNLLTIRLQKLAEMGLWSDALKFYNNTVNDPEDNQLLAETGVSLIFLTKGLSTACLESKVLKPRFSGDFWTQMEAICNAELYDETPIMTQMGDSAILKALYFEPDFKIAADNLSSLNQMSDLEILLARQRGRINYKNASLDDIADNASPRVKKLFLSDENAPEALRNKLNQPEEKQPEVEAGEATQQDVVRKMAMKLKKSESVLDENMEILKNNAESYPENDFYLFAIGVLNPESGDYVNKKDKINFSIEKLVKKQANKVKMLNSLLDKSEEFSNNPTSVYEKQSGLVLLTALDELSTPISENLGDNSLDKTEMPLIRLGNVGLIQQAHFIARDMLADIMLSQLIKEN